MGARVAARPPVPPLGGEAGCGGAARSGSASPDELSAPTSAGALGTLASARTDAGRRHGTTAFAQLARSASRFTHEGGLLPVSRSHASNEKWLQFLCKRWYALPRYVSASSRRSDCTCDCDSGVRPTTMLSLKRAPPGTQRGGVSNTPLDACWWPPKAYSLPYTSQPV